jgi:hypothetical protein
MKSALAKTWAFIFFALAAGIGFGMQLGHGSTGSLASRSAASGTTQTSVSERATSAPSVQAAAASSGGQPLLPDQSVQSRESAA